MEMIYYHQSLLKDHILCISLQIFISYYYNIELLILKYGSFFFYEFLSINQMDFGALKKLNEIFGAYM
jgi:hypothetical protein